MNTKQLQGQCQHCGGIIEFNAEYAGTTGECPRCHQQTEFNLALPPEESSPLRRKAIVFSFIGLLILTAGLIGANMALKRAKQLRADRELASTPPPAPPAPKTEEPFAREQFRISSPQIFRTDGSSIIYAIGSITNTANRQRFGVRVELELLDSAGVAIGATSDYTKIVEPRAEWRYRALVVDKRASTAKILRITESK